MAIDKTSIARAVVDDAVCSSECTPERQLRVRITGLVTAASMAEILQRLGRMVLETGARSVVVDLSASVVAIVDGRALAAADRSTIPIGVVVPDGTKAPFLDYAWAMATRGQLRGTFDVAQAGEARQWSLDKAIVVNRWRAQA